MTHNGFRKNKVYRNNNNKQKSKTKIFSGPGNRTRDLWHPSLMRYLSVTETTKGIDYSATKQICGPYISFFLFFLYYLNMHGCFSYLRENDLLIDYGKM